MRLLIDTLSPVYLIRNYSLPVAAFLQTQPKTHVFCSAPITHMMYVDDIILFSKATRKNTSAIMNYIDKYCMWSGQKLNALKSRVFFSQNSLTSITVRRAIKHIL